MRKNVFTALFSVLLFGFVFAGTIPANATTTGFRPTLLTDTPDLLTDTQEDAVNAALNAAAETGVYVVVDIKSISQAVPEQSYADAAAQEWETENSIVDPYIYVVVNDLTMNASVASSTTYSAASDADEVVGALGVLQEELAGTADPADALANAAASFAELYTGEAIPVTPVEPEFPPLTTEQIVVDEADMLTADEEQALADLVNGVREDGDGLTFGFRTVESLEGMSVQQFATSNGEAWAAEVGATDTGVYVVLAAEEQATYIATAGMLQQVIPRARVEEIRGGMVADLNGGDISNALESVVTTYSDEYITALESGATPTAGPPTEPSEAAAAPEEETEPEEPFVMPAPVAALLWGIGIALVLGIPLIVMFTKKVGANKRKFTRKAVDAVTDNRRRALSRTSSVKERRKMLSNMSGEKSRGVLNATLRNLGLD